MITDLGIIKGIHPGIILERELKCRKLGKSKFALSIYEFPQTIVAITKGRRRMNTALSLKIEKALQMEEGYFMILQIYHDIRKEKCKNTRNLIPDLTLIRPVVFWDTTLDKINWIENRPAVIRRIFERGNEQEIREIIKFYGRETVEETLDSFPDLLASAIENKRLYLAVNS